MPKQSTGSVRWVNGVAVARVRLATGRPSFELPGCSTEADAQERAGLLATVARRLRSAGVDEKRATEALDHVAKASPRSLRNVLAVIADIVGGEVVPVGATHMPTFKQVGEMWTSGELQRRYPDQIRAKKTVLEDISRMTNHVYDLIGDTPIDRVTLDLCEQVMRALPASLSVSTRRNVGHMMVRVLKLAVYPLRLITASPIPAGFLPSIARQKALAHLYADEEARLMACIKIPIAYRMLWGFLAREGMREGEALALTWGDLDLERGAVRLDRNKTDDPRAWALGPGVAAALKTYRDCFRPTYESADRVFTAPSGQALVGPGLAVLLRQHLRAIDLDKERPELFTSTTERRRIRVHDLRGTFVTLSLANGKSESWISDRTGHRSSVMIARYKRIARTFAELRAGELQPLHLAVPELRQGTLLIGHGMDTNQAKHAKTLVTPTRFELVLPA